MQKDQKSTQSSLSNAVTRLSSKEIKILCLVGALLVLWFIYGGHFHNGFFYDDVFVIQQNPSLNTLKNIPLFFTDIRAHGARPDYQIYYRPFFLLSFAWDYWLGKGMDTFIMHVHTFIGFLGLIALVFFFVKKVFGHFMDNTFYPALFATCCFAFHPIVADVINYHTGRDVAFATMYGMLYMVLYLYSAFCRKYFLYLIPLIIGCLFMAPAMVFMPLLWLYIIYFERDAGLNHIFKSVKETWKPMLPGIITMVVASGIVLLKSKPDMAHSVDRFTYILTQPHVILNFFMLFFNPENLNPNAWRDFVTTVHDYHFVIGSLFIAVLLISIYLLSLSKTWRTVSYGLSWFIICLLPTHSILPLFIAQNDYHMFPSVIGLSIVVAAITYIIMKRISEQSQFLKFTVIAGCLVFMVSMAYGSRQRVKVWSSDRAMWEDILKKDPTNGRVLMNIGVYYLADNNLAMANDYFEKARVYAPTYDLVYVNLALVKSRLGDTATAHVYLKYAVSLNGFDHAACNYFYAYFLHQWHHDEEAIPLLRTAIAENTGYEEAWNLLMQVYYEQRDKELANTCRQALNLMPDNVYASNCLKQYMADSNRFIPGGISDSAMEKASMVIPSVNNFIALSLQYFNKGEFQKCIDVCYKAIALDSTSSLAYNNMCAAYNQLKEWDKAIIAGDRAIHFAPDFTLAKNNLNFALTQRSSSGNK
jgi:tetratricopeptide (TPR) repeat protein